MHSPELCRNFDRSNRPIRSHRTMNALALVLLLTWLGVPLRSIAQTSVPNAEQIRALQRKLDELQS